MRTAIRFPQNRRSKSRGGSVVEFALSFMLFLVVVVALVDLGRGVWTYTTIAHATRQGARYAAIHGAENPATANQIRDAVRAQAVGLDRNEVEVTTTYPSGFQRGGTVQVQARYSLRLVTSPLIISGSTIALQSTSKVILAN